MFNRRVFLGGAASAAILASSVLTAGTAMADATPQVTNTASALLSAVGPAFQLPGILAALQVLPAGSTLSTGSSSVSSAVSSVVPASATSGVLGSATSVIPALGGLSSVTSGIGSSAAGS